MYQLIIIVHVLLGLSVVGLILMQQGKGADAGAAFSGGSGSVFGSQGAASFLSRTTAILAALFFTTSLGLAVLSGYENKPDDLMEQPEIEQPLADVPIISENQPTINSIPTIITPTITPTSEIPTSTTPVIESTVTPVIDSAKTTESTTEAVELIVPTTPTDETTSTVTQP